MTTVGFRCPRCLNQNTIPVTVGYTDCKFRGQRIKMLGEQCTSDWMTVTKEDCCARFDPSDQATWSRLVIEYLGVDDSTVGERCLIACNRWTIHWV